MNDHDPVIRGSDLEKKIYQLEDKLDLLQDQLKRLTEQESTRVSKAAFKTGIDKCSKRIDRISDIVDKKTPLDEDISLIKSTIFIIAKSLHRLAWEKDFYSCRNDMRVLIDRRLSSWNRE